MITFVKTISVLRMPKVFGFVLLWAALTVALLYRVSRSRDLWEPYAEDGSALILGALAAPWSLSAPVVDAVFVASRLFATIATSLSLVQAPFILSLLSAATVSCVAIYLLRPSLSLVAPSLIHRSLLSLLILGGIGTLQVAGFAMCVSYVLTLFLVILAVEEPPIRSKWLMPIVLILSFSTNSSFVAAPIFLIRGVVERDRRLFICGCLTAAPLPVIFALVGASRSPHSVSHFKGVVGPLVAIAERSLFYLFVVPISGGLLSGLHRAWQVLALIASSTLYLTMWFKGSWRAKRLSLGLASSAVCYIAAHAFGRAYSITGSISDFRLTPDRFAFLLLPCVVMAWSVLIFDQRWLSGRVRNVFFGLVIIVQLLTTVSHEVQATQVSSINSWARFAGELAAARKGPAGGDINDAALGPVHGGVPWGLIRCDTSDARYIRCMDLRGNRDGAVYEISRSHQ